MKHHHQQRRNYTELILSLFDDHGEIQHQIPGSCLEEWRGYAESHWDEVDHIYIEGGGDA